jgi:hypothetical protein
LRERLVKIGARIVCHGLYLLFQPAEVAVPRALFAAILRQVERLRGPICDGLIRTNRETAGAQRRTMRSRLVKPPGRPREAVSHRSRGA